MTAYQAHKRKWGQCTACPLWKTRKHVVLCKGTVPCDLLFIGEAPGDSEDVLGQPFVGPAGHLLHAIVARAIPASLGLKLAYTNLTACVPIKLTKKDHAPTRESMDKCRPRLAQFVSEVAQPRLIVMVGRLSKAEIGTELAMGKGWLKGKKFCEITHPSAMLQAETAAEKSMMIKTATVALESAVVNLIRGARKL